MRELIHLWRFEPVMIIKPSQASTQLTSAGWPGPLKASTFNHLDQHTSSPGNRAYGDTELTCFFPSGGQNHRQYLVCLPMEGRATLSWPQQLT